MRQKAQESLLKLSRLKPQRNYVTINNDISSEWYRCEIGEKTNRTMVIKWANDHCLGKFSRDYSHYYFENERDAFAYRLKWS